MKNRYLGNKYNKYAILILSCDKYSDLWKPFFSQFHKFWPRCPFKVYLGSNTKRYNDPAVPSILSGSSVDWSSDLLKILQKMKEEYIFIWVDDFFPTNTVHTDLFLKGFQFMERVYAHHIHMAPRITPDGYSPDRLFGYYEKGSPYRVILCGFWNKAQLQKILLPGENPWKFEIMGSYRSSYSDGYYTIMKPVFELIRVVEKGKISRQAYDYCRKNGIELDLNTRHLFSFWEKVKSDIHALIFDIILTIPWKTRVKTMDIFRRLIVSY